jgi:hypothetical protein
MYTIEEKNILKEYKVKSFNELAEPNWTNISYNQGLSEGFIEKYANKLNWPYICQFQDLSENIINKYINKIDFKNIFTYQKLSNDFLTKFKIEFLRYFLDEYVEINTITDNMSVMQFNFDETKNYKERMYELYCSAKGKNLNFSKNILYSYVDKNGLKLGNSLSFDFKSEEIKKILGDYPVYGFCLPINSDNLKERVKFYSLKIKINE